MRIEVYNSTRQKGLPKKTLAKTAEYILVSEKKRFDVNIVLVGSQKIRTMNRMYRDQDKATDVLSFAPEESDDPLPFEPVGEIYICVPIAKRQAQNVSHSLKQELTFLTAHGALHLCGYTHETDQKYRSMMEKTEKYIRGLGR